MPSSKHIIIKVTNDAIWFNDVMSVDLLHTNLPYGEFGFAESRTIFWEAEMISYDKSDNHLALKVINYRPGDVDDFLNQVPKAKVDRISFEDIYWPAFNADLSFYKKSSFTHLLSDHMPIGDNTQEIKIIHVQAAIPFSKVRFGAGCITFEYLFPWEKSKTEVRISNPHLLPEFEYVKTYFAKHFNSRTFEVLMVVSKSQIKIEKIIATSPQIDQIKDVAIETIKFIKTETLRKPPKYVGELDKSLFTPDDIFDPMDKNMLGTYNMTEKELLDHIMKWENIRNKKHLEYLSGHLHSAHEKIRFTLTPKFGFLFVVKGEKMVHYIWEMLNTNATYVWSFFQQETNQKQIEKLEELISFIRIHGRAHYLQHLSDDDEVIFRRVLHQGAGSNLVDYFPRWRHSINEAMV
ncbi:MAG: hypothetical protein WAU01_11540 [Saprospiraceae bacterium]